MSSRGQMGLITGLQQNINCTDHFFFFSFFLLLTNFTAVLWNTLLYLASHREHVMIIASDPKK